MVWLSIEKTIRQNLTDMQFCVSRLAILLDISPSYLREIVHRHFKTTPQKLIQKHRIEYAITLLSNLEKVQKVSRIVGYGTSRAFRNAFYKELGLTPREFKRQVRRSTAISPTSKKSTEPVTDCQPGFDRDGNGGSENHPVLRGQVRYAKQEASAGRAAEYSSVDRLTGSPPESGEN